ncbi:polynucleotide adenylyltransferase PcnB [unidentified bacterial endosymbiont]|uniref:polynucleotide adenylyltransferase PcnB n=1 Tax=unidentified bacterial endosymbiont TaxID=2355 RepID=UPI00209DC5F2|nr:polynucleotide adenylyltransferase PcnB [unidentified bacterial endosymbiont]
MDKALPAARALEVITPRAQHSISRQQIQPNALKVLYRLHQSGYQAYLVGGGVRDLLLGQQPKDFDITTDATPDQVRQLFNNCRLVGRRFRLAHVLFGRDRVEVATFRAHHTTANEHNAQQNEQGRLLRDNVYGTIEEDAQRRDFTINSLYYNIADFTVHDYTGGLKDLRQGVIRLIGDAESRYREDPVRMLRAVRFAAKLQMPISECTAKPIQNLAPLLLEIPAARLFEESLKLLQSGCGYATYRLLEHYHLFTPLFPSMAPTLNGPYAHQLKQMLQQALQSCDQRLATGKTVNPAFLFAALLWYPLLTQVEQQPVSDGVNRYTLFMQEASKILATQCRSLAIPRRFTIAMREIWQLQQRLPRCQTARAQKLQLHPKFRAAFDLLAFRAAIEGGPLIPLVAWWQEFQQQHPQTHTQQPRARDNDPSAKRPRTRRRRHTPHTDDPQLHRHR